MRQRDCCNTTFRYPNSPFQSQPLSLYRQKHWRLWTSLSQHLSRKYWSRSISSPSNGHLGISSLQNIRSQLVFRKCLKQETPELILVNRSSFEENIIWKWKFLSLNSVKSDFCTLGCESVCKSPIRALCVPKEHTFKTGTENKAASWRRNCG